MSLDSSAYLHILRLCNLLRTRKGEPSSLAHDALEQLCGLYKTSCTELLTLHSEYAFETKVALNSLKEYSLSVDNWKVEGCQFGLRDQCSILSLLLVQEEQDFEPLGGNFRSVQQIYKILEEWKGIKFSNSQLR